SRKPKKDFDPGKPLESLRTDPNKRARARAMIRKGSNVELYPALTYLTYLKVLLPRHCSVRDRVT
ncbi:MAG TPA: hypothetical protein VKA15_07310, partial [Isosphaeraceae bacterium]|nr:hypothetical protein [Isosphaeraceae bacterium]